MVESYLEIERARYGDRLRSSIEIPAGIEKANVPPMSVQSLVENAVKHGIAPRSGGEVAVKAVAENGTVRVEIRDTGPGFDLSLVPAGHGLDNLVSRLHTLYGPTAGLKVTQEDGHSVVQMVLPLA